jgi:hypothetical protein
MGLEIIGAGFGRTGTLSLKMALEQLGLGPCYHMMEVHKDQGRAAAWLEASRGASPDWEAIFDGFASTVDWPACTFWRELAEAYPDAKVLLSQREATGWHKSVMNTIYRAITSVPDEATEGAAVTSLTMATDLVLRRTFDGKLADADYAIEVFNRHNQAVRDAIAPERLLVYEPGQGWEPLCEFFGVSVPDTDYPHANTTESFQQLFGGAAEKTSG